MNSGFNPLTNQNMNLASGVYATYIFTYNTDSIPHLPSITNLIGTGEVYEFGYVAASLGSPISLTSFGETTMLESSTVYGLNMTTSLSYFENSNGTYSGELQQATFPYGGWMWWTYGTATYSSGLSYRQVTTRYLSKDGTVGSELVYTLSHEGSPGTIHQYTTLTDASQAGAKYWVFAQTGASMGLVTEYQGQQLPGPVAKTENDFTWSQDSIGNNYISSTVSTLDPGQSYQAQSKTTQAIDGYGNVTQVQKYNYGNLSTPARTYTYTYLNSSAYLAKYIFNRLVQASVTDGTNNETLASNVYDLYGQYGNCPGMQAFTTVSGLREWDTSFTSSVTKRGNVVCSTVPAGTTTMNYDISGNAVSTVANGVTTQVSTTSGTNYAAPSQLSVGSLSTGLSWSSFLGLTNDTGPNGDSSSTYYDQYARQTSTTSPFGATTTYTYNSAPYSNSNPATVKSTTNGRWSQTTMDGLGHTILTTAGDANGTKSQAESVYGPCACSPMLKLMQQAVPHASGAQPAYTTYTYDGIGRTVSVVAPDGASTTTYAYQGNAVTVTDPAGKWKTFTMDALGHLTQVTEPDPANPTTSTYVTTYTFDLWDNLNTVTMPRPTGTQTRSFTYSGPYLQSATNPENGTVSYTYNSYNKVASKTDAKGQEFVYSYDSYSRLTGVQVYPQGPNSSSDPCQQVSYYYDTNPFDSSYSGSYSAGRLTAIQYFGGSVTYAQNQITGPFCDTTFQEMYDYSQAGGEIGKRLRISRSLYTGSQFTGYQTVNYDLNSSYVYDNEGRMTSIQYPNSGTSSAPVTGPNLGWAFDTMGRLNTMTDLAAQTSLISGTTYGASNQLLTITAGTGPASESRTYNAMLQLTQLTVTGVTNTVNMTYTYSSSQNNGKIISQTDAVSGETVQYTYDSLNRLATAEATNSSWGQSYTYDGFGNLTDQNVIAGSAPTYSAVYDPSTNHPTGSGTVDANGNLLVYEGGGTVTYDSRNRMAGVVGLYQYSYDPGNKRVWRGVWTSGTLATDEMTFWSVSGQKLATYQLNVTQNVNPPTMYASQTGTNYYFGTKLIKNAGGYIGADRLGSIGHFYPFGQEKPSATQNGTEKFTGYFRDAETGLDYAMNRYHNPGTGRFLTPDPYSKSASASNPGSWNRYAYVQGNPINVTDPTGLFYDPNEDDAGCYYDEGSGEYVCDGGDSGGDDEPLVDDGTLVNGT